MNIASTTLTVTVQDWFYDSTMLHGDNKTFWVVAQGNPFGTWKSVQLSFIKYKPCNSTVQVDDSQFMDAV